MPKVAKEFVFLLYSQRISQCLCGLVGIYSVAIRASHSTLFRNSIGELHWRTPFRNSVQKLHSRTAFENSIREHHPGTAFRNSIQKFSPLAALMPLYSVTATRRPGDGYSADGDNRPAAWDRTCRHKRAQSPPDSGLAIAKPWPPRPSL